ncbi:MAG: diadenylate cyclase [Bradymonadia bacterium]
MFASLTEALSIGSAWDLILTVVDFAIVYTLIYQILLLIRGTRAVQMLVGLLLIIFGYFISRDEYLGLSTLHWLLDKFIASFILLIVVLFQNDIRRALSSFGRTSYFSGLSSEQGAQLVEELVRAAVMLGRNRIGGLIVVERDGDLSPFAEEGIQVDALVTHETLYATFNPANANPLHDGAAVIRGDRLVAAGCFLPLSSNPRIDKALGTRHRAAIGLTEDNDALVVVVSEETGTISIAKDGKLERDLDANALRDVLQRELGLGTRDPRTTESNRVVA